MPFTTDLDACCFERFFNEMSERFLTSAIRERASAGFVNDRPVPASLARY